MVKKLRLKESKDAFNEIIKKLDDFGFECWDANYLWDYFMWGGLVATFNTNTMKGYFTWNPDGNVIDVGEEYDNIDKFLDAVYDYNEYNPDELIKDGFIKKGFEINPDEEYCYENGDTYAKFDFNTDRGYIEYSYSDGDVEEKEDLYLLDFIEELFM